jgi:hypothetical protein
VQAYFPALLGGPGPLPLGASVSSLMEIKSYFEKKNNSYERLVAISVSW